MFDWARQMYTLLRMLGYVKRASIALESIAESQRLLIKLECIRSGYSLDDIKEAEYTDEPGQVLSQSDLDLAQLEAMQEKYRKLTGAEPDMNISVGEMKRTLED